MLSVSLFLCFISQMQVFLFSCPQASCFRVATFILHAPPCICEHSHPFLPPPRWTTHLPADTFSPGNSSTHRAEHVTRALHCSTLVAVRGITGGQGAVTGQKKILKIVRVFLNINKQKKKNRFVVYLIF